MCLAEYRKVRGRSSCFWDLLHLSAQQEIKRISQLGLKASLREDMFQLTELLNGPVCAPRQLQGHMDPAPLVFHSLVRLQGDPRAGCLRDDGHQLDRKEVWVMR